MNIGTTVTVFLCQSSEVLVPTSQTSSTNLQLSELALLGQKAIEDGEGHAEDEDDQDKVTQHHVIQSNSSSSANLST